MASTDVNKVTSIYRPVMFAGKVAIVTGGGSGIGKAITKELLLLGCNVMIASRNQDRLNSAAAEIRRWLTDTRSDARLELLQCNIRNEKEAHNLISATIETFGALDFLINNGGGQFISRAEDIRLKGWNAVVETNLTGTFLMCREAYNLWMKDHGGVIVNIIMDMWKGYPLMRHLRGLAILVRLDGSDIGRQQIVGRRNVLTSGHSGAARAGVENLAKSLALEWVHNKVRVNCIAPGSSIYSETAAANYGDMKIFDQAIPRIPMRRLGSVEEVSSATCFLLSPAATFITGETIKVDGGQSIYTTPTYIVPDHSPLPAYTWERDLKQQKTDHTVKHHARSKL